MGLGVSRLSVGANSIRQVRQALDGLTLEACRTAAGAALRAGTSAEVREVARSLSRRNGGY